MDTVETRRLLKNINLVLMVKHCKRVYITEDWIGHPHRYRATKTQALEELISGYVKTASLCSGTLEITVKPIR